MAGNKLGMEIAEVRKLGKSLQSDSDVLTQAAQQITSQLNGTFWKGADAERFKNQWNSEFQPKLKQVATALDEFGQLAGKQADEQEKASN
ncbi:WXG100 family type VII secretion target [Isoptericola sp. F-RaC21]|uniref:WXG100 family type VII secretion target n=1 Tax=Isoptericola sp. F-RaC21 TaxID=3141452 RepID=UPI00315B54A0